MTGPLFKRLPDGTYAEAFIRRSDGTYAPARADEAACCCGEDPPTGSLCYVIGTSCTSTNPAVDQYAISADRFLSVAYQFALGNVVEFPLVDFNGTPTGGVFCFVPNGFLFVAPDGNLPSNVLDVSIDVGQATAVHDDCLASPCGLVKNDACPGCVTPNFCVEQVAIPANPWFARYGYDAWCARGAIMVATTTATGRYNYTGFSFNADISGNGSLSYYGRSITRYRANGFIDSNQFSESGSLVWSEVDRFGNQTGENKTFNLSQASGFGVTPILSLSDISARPFAGGSSPSVDQWRRDKFNDRRPTANIVTGGCVDNSEVVSQWGQAVLTSNPLGASWTCSYEYTDSGTGRLNRGSINESHEATIAPKFGSASWRFSINQSEYFDEFGAGRPGFYNGTNSFTITENRQVFWFPPGFVPPDYGAGCPLVVRAIACNGTPDEIKIDATQLLPLPAVVVVDWEGEQRCFRTTTQLVEPGGELPVLATYESCNESPCGGQDGEGRYVTDPPESRPTYPIPDDFDPEAERRRIRAGGCCGQPGG